MAEIPEQYKKGFIKFLNCKIDLSKRVLIPRIETEYWVEKVIKELQIVNGKWQILDIFAGSGCIGIAVLKNIKESFVDFIDIDERAVSQIKINLELNKISKKRYKVLKSDFFENVIGKKYNVIFANPPYVASKRLDEIGDSVLEHEPQIALFSGKKGLNHIKKFLKGAKGFLKEQGIIYLEFDPLQKEEIKDLLREQEYKYFEFFKDQFKKYRWVKISLNQ